MSDLLCRSDALCTNVQDNGLGNPDLPLEVSQPEVAPGQAALLETDALPTQVKPDAKASAIVTDSVHVVDNSLFLHQQEVAARFVLQLLADATKVVASKCLDEMPDKGDSLPMETDEGDSLLKSRLSQPEVVPAALLEAEAQMKPDAKVSAVVNDSVNVNAASTVYNSQFLHQHEVAARFVSQLLADATKILVTEKGDSLLEADVPADVISVHVDAWSALDMSTFLQQQEVAARLVSKLLTDATEIMASYLDPDSGKEERKVCQAESQASPIKDLMTQDKSALRESQTETSAATDSQVAATLFESKGAEAKENVEDIILPQEDATIAITAQKLVDRLVQNPSAEDVVKGFSLVADTDVHLESYEHQALLNKLHVEDGDIPAAKLYKRIIFMEKPKTQGSSVQIPEHYIAGHLELPDDHSAALDIGPQYERPRSADRLTPMSDESDAWLTWYVCCGR